MRRNCDILVTKCALPAALTLFESDIGWKLDEKFLVANAGIGKAAPIEEHSIEDFDNLFATNVRAPFFLVQQLLPLLTENSSVVLGSSMAARVAPGSSPGAISLPAYASTKGALDTLVKPPQKSPKSKREQVPPRHWVGTYLTYCLTTRAIASSRKKGVSVNYPHSLNVRSGIPGSNVLAPEARDGGAHAGKW